MKFYSIANFFSADVRDRPYHFTWGLQAAKLPCGSLKLLKLTIMKKILLIAAVCCFHLGVMAASPNEKVLNNFTKSYPDAENVTWSEGDDNYVVYFKKGDVQFRLWYNKWGSVTQTIRYYDGEFLHPFVRSKVASKYKDWDVKFVTELTSEQGTQYNVSVEKGNEWHSLVVNSTGEIRVDKKYRKR